MKRHNNQGHVQHPTWDPDTERLNSAVLHTEKSRGDDAPRPNTYHGIDESLEAWYTGAGLVLSIMMEIAEEREAGTLRPFVEGEPIGKIQKRKPFRPPLESPAQRYEQRQERLRTLRVKNDRAIARILGG